MATTGSKMAPAASRQWLAYAGGAFLLVIGAGLMYRQITGQTLAQQRAASMQERMQQELASKTPGNAEAYSTRLEASRRRAAEDAQKEAAKADEEAAEAAKGKSSKLPDPELAAKPQRGAHTGYAPSAEAGWPEGTPADDPRLQADAMAVQRTVDTNRRMGVWEGATQATPKANSPEAALAQLAQAAQASQGLATGRAGAPEGGTSAALSALVAAAQNAQGAGAQRADTSRDSEFLRQTAAEQSQDLSPLRAKPGIGRYGLVEGTPIEVAMMTAVNSDHGGKCKAQVARDVYDSLTQTQVLIPAGTRALCTYNSVVAQGDARLFMAFTRLIFPSTAHVQLGAMQGTDMQGAVGIGAEVDSHFWSIFGSSFLIAMVARAAESSSSSGVTVNLSGAAAGGAAASALSDASRKALERNINIRQTMRVGFGEHLVLVTTRDMVLDPSVTGVLRGVR